MNTNEHEQYLSEFKSYLLDVVSTHKKAQDFLIRSGINTKSGKLSKQYSPSPTKKSQSTCIPKEPA